MKTEIQTLYVQRQNILNEDWNDFISHSPQHSIYAKSFYLDAVQPGWSALFCWNAGKLIAVMPICMQQKFAINCVFKPKWTQYLGIFFAPLSDKQHRIYYLQKQVTNSIIKNLSSLGKLFNYNFMPSFDYYLPFYWNKYSISPRQSYQLELNVELKEIYQNFSSSAKNSIKRAQNLNLKIIESNSIDALCQIMFDRKIINAKEMKCLKELWANLRKQNCCFTMYVLNEMDQKIYCGGAFLIDDDKLIFLASGLDFQYKRTGAASFMIWHAIQKATKIPNIKYFDFEGSVIENIENYFRTFGAKIIVYYNIEKLIFPFNIIKNVKEKYFFKKVSH